MRRYIRLYKSFVKNCFIRELEFRTNFILGTIMSFIWAVVSFSSIEIIFGQFDSLAGWAKEEVMLLSMVYLVVNGVLKITVENNVSELPAYVGQGQLDGMLLKPLSARFLVSLRYVNFSEIPRTVVFFIIMVGYAFLLTPTLSVLQLFSAFLIMCLGGLGMYSFLFLVNLISFWKPSVWNLAHLSFRLRNLSSFPADIYKGVFRGLVYILPTAILTTIPTLFLLGKGNFILFVYSVLVSFGFYFATAFVWKRGLMRYESASS